MTKQLSSVLAQFSLVTCLTLAAGACMPTADGGDDGTGDGVSADAAPGAADGAAAAGVNGCTEFTDLSAVDATRTITEGAVYTPSCITIKVGQAVTIGASGEHPMRAGIVGTSDPTSSGSGIPSGSNNVTVAYTFDTAGTFGFYCENHGTSGMRGAIKVIP